MEWDEPGCCDKQNRVSPWEVETPESLFIFPSLTSGLKRPFHSGFLGKFIFCHCFLLSGLLNINLMAISVLQEQKLNGEIWLKDPLSGFLIMEMGIFHTRYLIYTQNN